MTETPEGGQGSIPVEPGPQGGAPWPNPSNASQDPASQPPFAAPAQQPYAQQQPFGPPPQWQQQSQQPYPPQGPQPQYPPYQQYPSNQQWATPQAQPWSMPPAPRSGSKVKAAVFSGVGVLVVVAVIVGLLIANKSSHGSTPIALVTTNSASGAAAGTAETPPTAATTTSPLPSCDPAASTSDETVGYRPCGTAARDVGVPTYDTVAAHRTYTVTIKTNHGDIVFTANGSAAPYTVYSFVYLVQKQYFDNTPCHRLVTAGIFVLQCGDPSGTGSGGPGYAFQDENLASLGTVGSGGTVTYKAGTVAMANAGPDTNGSQFFLVYKDSPISRAYTPFGTITQGLGVIQQIAAAGSDNTNGSGDGAPLDSVKIESVTVQ